MPGACEEFGALMELLATVTMMLSIGFGS